MKLRDSFIPYLIMKQDQRFTQFSLSLDHTFFLINFGKSLEFLFLYKKNVIITKSRRQCLMCLLAHRTKVFILFLLRTLIKKNYMSLKLQYISSFSRVKIIISAFKMKYLIQVLSIIFCFTDPA